MSWGKASVTEGQTNQDLYFEQFHSEIPIRSHSDGELKARRSATRLRRTEMRDTRKE